MASEFSREFFSANRIVKADLHCARQPREMCIRDRVYTLLNVDRGVPEVWGSVYDIRDLLDATVKLRDGKKVTDMEMNVVHHAFGEYS